MSQQTYQIKRDRLVRNLIKAIEGGGNYIIGWNDKYIWARDIADKMTRKGILSKKSQRGENTYFRGPNFHLKETFH